MGGGGGNKNERNENKRDVRSRKMELEHKFIRSDKPEGPMDADVSLVKHVTKRQFGAFMPTLISWNTLFSTICHLYCVLIHLCLVFTLLPHKSRFSSVTMRRQPDGRQRHHNALTMYLQTYNCQQRAPNAVRVCFTCIRNPFTNTGNTNSGCQHPVNADNSLFRF